MEVTECSPSSVRSKHHVLYYRMLYALGRILTGCRSLYATMNTHHSLCMSITSGRSLCAINDSYDDPSAIAIKAISSIRHKLTLMRTSLSVCFGIAGIAELHRDLFRMRLLLSVCEQSDKTLISRWIQCYAVQSLAAWAICLLLS